MIRHGTETVPVHGKVAAMFGLLATAPQQVRARETIADMLWGTTSGDRARQSLRQALFRLRNLPGSDAVTAGPEDIALDPAQMDNDLAQVSDLIGQGTREALVEAIGFYRGLFLHDVQIEEESWDEWLRVERKRWDETILQACVRLGDADLQAGNPSRAADVARRAIGIDALREDAHRLLMRALAALDRRPEALRHYDELALRLETELDAEPDELTQILAASMKEERQKASPAVTRIEANRAGQWADVLAMATGGGSHAVLVAEHTNGGPPRDVIAAAMAAALAPHGGAVLAHEDRRITVEIPHVPAAIAAGLSLLRQTPGLRAGLHIGPRDTSLRADEPDGTVSTARQLARLAERGQLVLSAEARELMVASVDAEITDLGERPAEAAGAPLRAFIASPPTEGLRPQPGGRAPNLRPLIAVIPFATVSSDPGFAFLGDLIADEITALLSRSIEVGVVSRLSCIGLKGRNLLPEQVRDYVGATWVLSGSATLVADTLWLALDFVDARNGSVVWADQIRTDPREALMPDGIIETIVHRMIAGALLSEFGQARGAPLGSMSDCTLLLGAIGMMHQLTPTRFSLAHEMLQLLVSRYPDHAAPQAWLGLFYLLRVNQGWSGDIDADTRASIDCTQRALDAEPTNSLALAVDGHVQTHFLKDFDTAAQRLDLALASSPSNSLAWLFKCALSAFMGDGTEAMRSADMATRLSPLDPRRWYYDALAAAGALAAGDNDRAITLARRSIRENSAHASSFRALTVALSMAGRMEEARQAATGLMRLQPDLTVTDYLRRHPAAQTAIGPAWANALRRAGVPE
jgi:DNA-binding SARP family transcriptional activator/TolB-like protein